MFKFLKENRQKKKEFRKEIIKGFFKTLLLFALLLFALLALFSLIPISRFVASVIIGIIIFVMIMILAQILVAILFPWWYGM